MAPLARVMAARSSSERLWPERPPPDRLGVGSGVSARPLMAVRTTPSPPRPGTPPSRTAGEVTSCKAGGACGNGTGKRRRRLYNAGTLDEARLRQLLGAVASGELSSEDAMTRLAALPFEDLGFARVDHHRALRAGRGRLRPGQDAGRGGGDRGLPARPGRLAGAGHQGHGRPRRGRARGRPLRPLAPPLGDAGLPGGRGRRSPARAGRRGLRRDRRPARGRGGPGHGRGVRLPGRQPDRRGRGRRPPAVRRGGAAGGRRAGGRGRDGGRPAVARRRDGGGAGDRRPDQRRLRGRLRRAGRAAGHAELVRGRGERGQHRQRVRRRRPGGADPPAGTRGRSATFAYFDCFAGVAGDMVLGALLDAGGSAEALRAGLAGCRSTRSSW